MKLNRRGISSTKSSAPGATPKRPSFTNTPPVHGDRRRRMNSWRVTGGAGDGYRSRMTRINFAALFVLGAIAAMVTRVEAAGPLTTVGRDIVHTPSGVVFPPAVGGLQRV